MLQINNVIQTIQPNLKQRQRMKNFTRMLALLVFVVVLHSCDSAVTVTNPDNGTIENIAATTDNQGNPVDDDGINN